jgi:hypothetical protein
MACEFGGVRQLSLPQNLAIELDLGVLMGINRQHNSINAIGGQFNMRKKGGLLVE